MKEHSEPSKEETKLQSEQKITLQAFCEFLEKHGYLDSDWRDESPTAIDRFASQFKSQLPIEQKPLIDYLNRNKDKHEFRLVVDENGKGYIHALGQDSETLDFQL